MKRLWLALLVTLCPTVAAAQTPPANTGSDRTATEGLMLPAVAVSFAPAVKPEDKKDAATPPAPATTHRRPSLVGYLSDASIGSEVRVRFDSGTGIDAPDRAEFFYAKCGCYAGLPAGNVNFDPNAPGPSPGVVTDMNFQQLYVFVEWALGDHLSVYGDLPFRFIKPQTFAPGTGSFGDFSGLSDVRAGAKFALMASDTRYLTVQADFAFPTGDPAKGLGTNHTSFTPTLIFLQRMGDRFTIESQFGSVIPFGGSAGLPTTSSDKFSGTVLDYGAGASYELMPAAKFHVAPVVELVAWHVVNGFQTSTTLPADAKSNIANLKIGGRVGTDRHSFYVGYGFALTNVQWYDKIVRFEYRFGF
jgi:hypothetical protein